MQGASAGTAASFKPGHEFFMSRFNQKKLTVRILSALVLIPLTLWVIWTGKHMFTAFCIVGASLSFYEWRHIVMKLPRGVLLQLAGAVYIAVSGISFYLLREHFNFELCMAFMVMVWASDIGAYFTGKILGGPKLAVSISPNKTWAGFAGALITPGIMAMIWVSTHDLSEFPNVHYVLIYLSCFMTGALMGVVGQGGDLMISYFKRRSGLKDSGKLIPGHGGILDRIDSLIPNIPVFYVIALAAEYVLTG